MICITCKIDKQLDEFHKHSGRKTGRTSSCKECANARTSKWYSDNTEYAKKSMAAYYTENKEEMNIRAREWKAANPERKKELDRIWREENRERKAANDRAWVTANSERVKEIHRISQAKRLGIINASPVLFIDGDFITDMMVKQNNSCAICPQTLDDYHVDHIIPLSRGGKHLPSNIQLLCQPCNNHKASFMMSELVTRSYFKEYVSSIGA